MFNMTPSPWLIVVLTARLCSLARRGDYDAASKIALINTLKRRFIGDGEWSIDAVLVSQARNLRFMLSCAFGAAASKILDVMQRSYVTAGVPTLCSPLAETGFRHLRVKEG
jgi:hypothetical protein